jgi:hypothetical protein
MDAETYRRLEEKRVRLGGDRQMRNVPQPRHPKQRHH